MSLPSLIRLCFDLAEPSQSTAPDYTRLEERIVYSAAPLGEIEDASEAISIIDADEVSWHADAHEPLWVDSHVAVEGESALETLELEHVLDVENLNELIFTELRHELVFVDTQTEGYKQLVDDLRAKRSGTILDVVLLTGQTDGVEQISRTLETYNDLDAIHIVSHGSDGNIELGSTVLNLDSLSGQASKIAIWGEALHSDGDLLFYGCDLAASERGVELLESIGELTAADVAASEDLTGHASLGGDWVLEFEQGDIESNVAFSIDVQSSWFGSLGIADIDEQLVNSDPAIDLSVDQSTSRDDGLRNANSAVAISPNTDRYVVAWTEASAATGDDVYFQLFDWAGRTVGNAVRVNETIAGNQDDAAVAMDADGNFIVVWESIESGPTDNDIMARRFDANGVPLAGTAGDQFRVHSVASGDQHNPDVDMNDAGQFVVGWEQRNGSLNRGFIKIYDENAVATTGADVLVNQGMGSTSSDIGGLSVGMDGAGNVVVAWDELDTTNVEIRRFDNSGNALPNAQVGPNSVTINLGFGNITLNADLEHPDVDVREDGHVAISMTGWAGGFDKGTVVQTFVPDLSNSIVVDLFNATVNDSFGDHINSSIVYYDDDTALVTWDGPSNASDVNDSRGVYGKLVQSLYDGGTNSTQIVDIAGEQEFTVNQTIAGTQRFASVASHEQGNFAVVWSGEGPGDSDGVFARQFGTENAPIAVDDDVVVLENAVVVFDPLDNDWDPNGDGLLVTSVDTTGLLGQAALNAGNITYDTNGQFGHLLPGEFATEQFTYDITDGTETATGTVTVQVDGVNSAPANQVSSGLTVSPGQVATLSMLDLETTDLDHVAADLVYTVTIAPDVQNGQLRLNGTDISTGDTFTQENVNNGEVTYEKTLQNDNNDQFDFTVADSLNATTVTHSFSLTSTPNRTISGFVFEDIDGNSDLADAIGIDGVSVSLYRDDGNSLLDAGDIHLFTTSTDATGAYTFTAGPGDFFVTVDSTSIEPAAVNKYNTGFGQGDVWAVQTYGAEGTLVDDGAGGVRELGPGGGAAYGGRVANQSDVSTVDITDKQHVTKVNLATADVSGVDYGFSFNVVTNTNAGGLEDDSTAERTVQGSLRQFIQNANAIVGGNSMRFVPVVGPNAGDWWRIDVTEALPSITDVHTTISGTAYSPLDGQTTLDTNAAHVGDTGPVGTGADGVASSGDEVSLGGVTGPELEIAADLADGIRDGLRILGDHTVVEFLAVRGFGDLSNSAGNIAVGDATTTVNDSTIQHVIVGSSPNASALDLSNAAGANSHGINFENASGGLVQNSVIAGSGLAGIKFDAASNITVLQNEIRGSGQENELFYGLDAWNDASDLIFRNNLLVDNVGGGIDLYFSIGQFQIEDNSVVDNGKSISREGFGLRVFGSDSVITHNVIHGNRDAGIVVVGDQGASGGPATQNQIRQNSFLGNGGLAIDLLEGNQSPNTSDGLNPLNGFDSQTGNEGIDRPNLQGALDSTIAFSGNWGSERPTLELYLASDPDPSDMVGGVQYGEGVTYIGELVFNGTNYEFAFANGYVVDPDDRIAAIAVDSQGNTSEFSNVVEVTFSPVAQDESFIMLEDDSLTARVDGNDSDLDGDPLTYSLVSPVSGVALSTDGSFSYTPAADFFGTQTFQYNVSDPDGNMSVGEATITVQSVNDEQTIVENQTLQAFEGDIAGISSSLLRTDDIDHTPSQLVYTVDVAPSRGRVEFSDSVGSAISSFTQADIDAGRVQYVHDSSDSVNDSFSFTVDDGEGVVSMGVFDIQITNVEEQLVVSSNVGVASGGTVVVSSSNLETQDVDDTPAQLVYVLTSNLQFGQLEFVGSPGVAINSFTQQDINGNSIQYVHHGASVAPETLSFDVDDGQGTISSGSLEIHLNNQPPQIDVNETLVVPEGQLAVVDASSLHANDSGSSASQLTYSLTSGPARGQLELSTNSGNSVTTFTQDDIDNGRLLYRHDSSDASGDSFNFVVSDGALTVASQFDIAVVNAEEQLVENNRVFVGKGDVVVLSPSFLLTTDSDDLASEIVYSVTASVANGLLFDAGAPTVAVTSFTQEDLNNGLIGYQHDRSPTTTDSFDFTVDDGQGSVSSDTLQFSIVNSEQVILNNNPLSVNEGTVGDITSDLLRTVDADNTPIERIYSVIGVPTNGQLELNTQPGVSITTFTQADINQGRLTYRHDSSDTVDDGFFFSVDDGFGPSSSGHFDIVVVNQEQQLVNNSAVVVGAGSFSVISSSSLLATDPDDSAGQLVYAVTSAPTNGLLRLIGNPTPISVFTQQQIDSGLVVYQHNGNDLSTDSFTFELDDGQGSLSSGVFQVVVEPVNEAPTVGVPGRQEASENTPVFFSVANGNAISLGDVDAGGNLLQLTLSAGNGTLRLASLTGLTLHQGNGQNDTVVVVEGTLSDLNAALDGLRFRPLQGYSGDANLDITLDDQGNTGVPGALQDSQSVTLEFFDRPNARNDEFQLIAGQMDFGGSLIANDVTPVGTTPPMLLTNPVNGDVTVHPDGTFSYSPNPNFVGTDFFVYQLENGPATDQAIVQLVVAPVVVLLPPTPESAEAEANPDSSEDGDGELIPPPIQLDELGVTEKATANRNAATGSIEKDNELEPSVSDVFSSGVIDRTVSKRVSFVSAVGSALTEYRASTQKSDSEFETGAYDLLTPLGQVEFYIPPTSALVDGDQLLFEIDPTAWEVPTGLVISGGLSIGWIAWSLNSGYLLGSLLSTLSPWTLVDPLPMFDSFGKAASDSKNEDDKQPKKKKDKLEEMID